MQDRKLYEQILGIESPWYVERVELKLECGQVHVHLEHTGEAIWECPQCGRACPLHDHTESRRWTNCDYQRMAHQVRARTPVPNLAARSGIQDRNRCLTKRAGAPVGPVRQGLYGDFE